MSRTDSPLKDRMIFAVGARRSGTFWLYRILSAHPEVEGVPAETHLISHGIAPLFERFSHGLKSNPQLGKVWMDRTGLHEATRDFCDRVFAAQRQSPDHYLVERTPVHVLHLDLISDIYPDARVIHIIRDGRDVARSLLAKPWGPDTMEDAAADWRDSILAARGAKHPAVYVELRYERLLGDPEPEIRSCFEQLGLPAADDDLARAVAAAKEVVNADLETGTVGTEKWRTALTPAQLRVFDEVAGELLEELGYPPSEPSREAKGRKLSLPRVSRPRLRKHAAGTTAEAEAQGLASGTWTRQDPAAPARMAIDQMDELLAAVVESDAERASRLLAADADFEWIAPGERDVASGSAARKALAGMVRDDPVAGITPEHVRTYVRPSGIAAIAEFRLADGSATERIFELTSNGGAVGRLVAYQLPVRS